MDMDIFYYVIALFNVGYWPGPSPLPPRGELRDLVRTISPGVLLDPAVVVMAPLFLI